MGLGKTVQAIAVLLKRAADGPGIVVAPTSVIFNWNAEITRCAPTLQPQILGEIMRRRRACCHPQRVLPESNIESSKLIQVLETMAGTIEEKILELHATKRDLAESLLEGTDHSGKLTTEELLRLIKP